MEEDPLIPGCRLSRPDQRARLSELRSGLFRKVTGTRTREGDVAFTFEGGEALDAELMEFIRYERGCCPDLSFALEFPAGGGQSLDLVVRGEAGLVEAWKRACA